MSIFSNCHSQTSWESFVVTLTFHSPTPLSAFYIVVHQHTVRLENCRFLREITEKEIQTQKRFKRTLLIGQKKKLQIFGVVPFIKLQNDN